LKSLCQDVFRSVLDRWWFWHQRQVKLQDQVKKVRAVEPGQEWKKGLISMGLLSRALMSPSEFNFEPIIGAGGVIEYAFCGSFCPAAIFRGFVDAGVEVG
jgi:hypothetical protein